jgi:hypothetical protein
MRYGTPWRRPRLAGLAVYYDEGWEAAEGASCPYEPPKAHGDGIRAHLWTHGAEDRHTARLIEELI